MELTFIETQTFTKNNPLNDDEYRTLQNLLLEDPACGVLIRGGGGTRKLRYKLENRGKSGGLRLIYFWHKNLCQIFLLFIYEKSEQTNITQETIKFFHDNVKEIKSRKISNLIKERKIK
jgi:hypothetical protein